MLDIDTTSLQCARENVSRNGLNGRIRLLERDISDALIPLEEAGVDSFDFIMTNPPFYESSADMNDSAKAKAKPPGSACTGTATEMICKGGELGFVGRILDQSMELRERVQWYTAMFGKLESLKAFVSRLRECKVDNWAVTEFVQGNRTRRWAIAWSYGPMRPAQSVARGINHHEARKYLPPVSEVEVLTWPSDREVAPLGNMINEVIGALQLLSWRWHEDALKGTGRARANVWSRAWKRKQAFGKTQKNAAETDEAEDASPEVCRLGFSVALHTRQKKTTASLRWVEGHDQPLFESFRGFLKAALTNL